MLQNPLEMNTSNDAIAQLLLAANEQQQRGDVSAAAATLERAIRISPKDPMPYYHLAQVRYEQSMFDLTEQLSRKALSLFSGRYFLIAFRTYTFIVFVFRIWTFVFFVFRIWTKSAHGR